MKDENDLVQSLLAHDEDVAVPAEHERRIREGLGALLGALPVAPAAPPQAPAPPGAAPAPAAPPASPATAVAGTALRKWVTTGVVAAIAAGGGFAVGRATAPEAPAAPPASMSTPVPPVPPVPPSTTATSAEPPAPPASLSASATAAPPPPTTTTAATPSTTTGGDGFDREQSLLERARSALVRHDASAAEKALDEHDRQFPRSRLAEERDYLRIQVLRERGDDARVRERAKAFLAKYPESMLRPRVEPLAK